MGVSRLAGEPSCGCKDRSSFRAGRDAPRGVAEVVFSDKNDPSIILSEKVNPAVDPQEDYAVVYEAVFEAASVDQMRIEIWVTDDGHVARCLSHGGHTLPNHLARLEIPPYSSTPRR